MTLPHADIDPDGLLEYSVVFTDRSLNHMSAKFVDIMQRTLEILREVYAADHALVINGGGTAAMESVARQLATGKDVLIVRNGLFSYRWSEILDTGAIAASTTVCMARPVDDEHQAPWVPAPAAEVAETIRAERPAVVFAPHVETASGMVLSDAYIREIAEATHAAGGLFVLDCIASGALWADMRSLGVDVLISAPQKGWSGSPGAGFVMLNDAARAAVEESATTSYTLDLRKWLAISDGYRDGAAKYHSTMPTDAIARNLEQMEETRARGFEAVREAQIELGTRIRELLAAKGLPSVAAPEVAAATVVVSYSDDPEIKSGARFKAEGLQVAAGVPLHCGEPADFSSFRMGLFGLDKLADIDGTVKRLEAALERMGL